MTILIASSRNINFIQKNTFSCSSITFTLQDDFELLGIPATSSKKEIKSAYFKKAKLFHPDNKNSSKSSRFNFQKLNDAYNRVLEDIDRHDNKNFRSEALHKQQRYQRRSEPVKYHYDEQSGKWTDQWGNEFNLDKSKFNKSVFDDEVTDALFRKAFYMILFGIMGINIFSVMYFIYKFHSGCRCQRCRRCNSRWKMCNGRWVLTSE